MKTKRYRFALAAFLSMLFPVLLRAQPISKDFPNLNSCPPDQVNVPQGSGGTMHLKLVWKGKKAQMIENDTAALASCDQGKTVAPRGMNALCNKCPGQFTNVGLGFVSTVNGAPCADFTSCCGVQDVDFAAINCVVGAGTGDQSGFVLQKQSNDIKFTVGPFSGSQINSVNHSTQAGNTITTDLYPHMLIALSRQGLNVDGLLKFIIKKIGVTQPITRQFDTTGMSLVEIYERAVTELAAAGISAMRRGGNESAVESHDPAAYLDGYVFIRNIDKQNVESLGVQWVRGARVSVESTVTPDRPGTPALTTWGIVLLVSLLLLAGSWILRRSARMQPA